MSFEYVLRGKYSPDKNPNVNAVEPVHLLVRLDLDALQSETETMSKVKRLYLKEIWQDKGRVDWDSYWPLASPPSEQDGPPLITFFGVTVYSLS